MWRLYWSNWQSNFKKQANKQTASLVVLSKKKTKLVLQIFLCAPLTPTDKNQQMNKFVKIETISLFLNHELSSAKHQTDGLQNWSSALFWHKPVYTLHVAQLSFSQLEMWQGEALPPLSTFASSMNHYLLVSQWNVSLLALIFPSHQSNAARWLCRGKKRQQDVCVVSWQQCSN